MMLNNLLTPKQQEELNYSILDYLQKNGLSETAECFQQETGFQSEAKYDGLLEKKWSSIVRLQKKILSLEEEIKELKEAGAHLLQRKSTSQAFALPREVALCLKGHQRGILAIAFHSLFSIVATASEDASVKLWDTDSGSLEKTLKGHLKSINDLCFTNDGRYLISCSSDLSIKIWSCEAHYQCIKTLYGHDNTISSICIIPTLDVICSVSRDETAKIWEIASGYCVQTLTGHSEWIRAVHASEEGDILITAGNDKTILVWDTSTWTIKGELRGHQNVIESIVCVPVVANKALKELLGGAISKNTEYVVSASRDKTVKLWSLSNFTCAKTFEGHENWVRGCCFYPDGSKMVTVGDDKLLHIWNLATGQVEKVESGHNQFLTCVKMNSQGLLMTGSLDNTSRGWRC